MHCARGCNCVLAAQRMVSVNQARSFLAICGILPICCAALLVAHTGSAAAGNLRPESNSKAVAITVDDLPGAVPGRGDRKHTSELQSRPHLVCRLLLEKKNKTMTKVQPLRP